MPALVRSSAFLPREISGLPPTGGSHRGTKDEMAKRPEKSDGRVVPEGARKDVPTAAMRGGKAVTASETVGQLRLSFETAAYPRGAEAKLEVDQAASGMAPVPKSDDTSSKDPPAMTKKKETRAALPASSLLGDGPQSSPRSGQGRGRDTLRGSHAWRPVYGIEFLEPGRPEEPDVRPTSPVP